MTTQIPKTTRKSVSTTDVLIVGAGPTGLTAATLLARYGVDFRIIDKNAAAATKSQALVVQARTLELWDKLGLAEGAVGRGQALDDVKFVNKQTVEQGGKPFMVLGRDGKDISPYPYLLVHEQYKTETMLLDDLATYTGPNGARSVERNTAVVGLEPTQDSVTVTLRRKNGQEADEQEADGQEETLTAKWLIAADGASSFVRKTLGLEFGGATYDDKMLVADVDLDWALERDTFYMQLPRQGLLAFLPMRGEGYSDTQYRIISRIPKALEHKENITGEDVQKLIDENSVAKTKVTATRWVAGYTTHRRMTEKFRVGRVFLAGDAAHIHSPSGGQGMNTGIQDAWNLAWKLALVVQGRADERLLDSYEPERIPVAKAVLSSSDRGFSFIGSSNPVFHVLRSVAVPRISSIMSLRSVGKTVFKTISQTWINYRKSPAVAGDKSAKHVQPGDRAPYALLNSGESIFSLLTGVNHHLLLFVAEGAEAKDIQMQAQTLFEHYTLSPQTHLIVPSERTVYEAYGVKGSTAFLVRPDGHIGWRGAITELNTLTTHLNKLYTLRSVLSLETNAPFLKDGKKKHACGSGAKVETYPTPRVLPVR